MSSLHTRVQQFYTMIVSDRYVFQFCVFLGLGFAFATGVDETQEVAERVLRGTTINERALQCAEPRILLQSGDIIHVGEEWMSRDAEQYASIKQEANANLVIRRRSDGQVLCESGADEPSDGVPYITRLYGDGNLITWRSPERIPPRVWKSKLTGDPSSTWFLAIDCDDRVSIYQNSVFGYVLWTCPDPSYYPQDKMVPTPSPTPQPTPQTVNVPKPNPITRFCVVADTPYHAHENQKLLDHVEGMDLECEFVAHLGDIRSARQFDTCVKETYTNASKIMQRSQKPVFMMLGDNEWNDCPNHEAALQMWHDEFDNFHHVYWEHDFNVTSQPGRVENLYFVHKQALFIMLNIVGGRVLDKDEWNDRLTKNFEWTRGLIEKHVRSEQSDANVVVIMAHATNSPNHRPFFHAMRDYIEYDLNNEVPILYLNGDTHSWNEQAYFYEQWNWKRITLTGNARDKPLKLTVYAGDEVKTVDEAFSFHRFY